MSRRSNPSRGQKLVDMCKQAKTQKVPATRRNPVVPESPVPAGAEEPPKGWLDRAPKRKAAPHPQDARRKLQFGESSCQQRKSSSQPETLHAVPAVVVPLISPVTTPSACPGPAQTKVSSSCQLRESLSEFDTNNNEPVQWKGLFEGTLTEADLENILFLDESLNPILTQADSVQVNDGSNTIELASLTPVEITSNDVDFSLPQDRHLHIDDKDDDLHSNIDYDNASEINDGDTSGEENNSDENEENQENGQNEHHQNEEVPQLPTTTPSRKRVRKPKTWKQNVAKELANFGKSYTSPTTGKVVKARAMRGPCACKKECGKIINEDDRKQIFDKFWAIGDHTLQWDFITRHVTCSPVCKRTTNNPSSRRQMSRSYSFVVGERKFKVSLCKAMFLNTLGIRQGWVDSAFKHLEGKTGAMSPDKRGKHANRPTMITEAQRATVRTHINMYPRTPSHYVRARSQREYLEWGLSIMKMFRHYKEWCEEENIPQEARASKTKYRTIFNTEFNIGFFRPKKDRCALCQIMKTGTRRERSHHEAKWVQHFRNKVAARKIKAQAKALGVANPSTVNVMAFDMQKVLPLPKSEVSTFFYKNKLSLYNLSVFDMIRKIGNCYLWHEALASRGANEISSCVRDYSKSVAAQGFKTIHSFSDSCSGQNKNRYFFAMMLLVAASCSIEWTHTFLEPGHTQNENDSVHALIESSAKLKEIFDLNEWIDIIKSAKVEEPTYRVKVMSQQDIYDFHPLVDKHQNWKRSTDGKQVKWSKVKILEANPAAVGVLKFKYDYNGEWETLNTKEGIVGRPVNLCTYRPPQAYASKLPLKKKKQDHLNSLCRSLDIPSKYHEFYFDIMRAETINEVEIDEAAHDNEEDSSDDEFYRETITRIPEQENAEAENAELENEDDIEEENL